MALCPGTPVRLLLGGPDPSCSVGGASLPLQVNVGGQGGCHSPSPRVDLNSPLAHLWTSGHLFANCSIGERSGHCHPVSGSFSVTLVLPRQIYLLPWSSWWSADTAPWLGRDLCGKDPLSFHWSWCDPVTLGFSHGYLSSKTVLRDARALATPELH